MQSERGIRELHYVKDTVECRRPPTAEQLAFSKEEGASADELVGRSILFKWPVVGWCVGKIVERNRDARFYKKIEGERETVNFVIFYEIDQDSVKTVLRLEAYGGEEEASWVLLESDGADAGPSGA